MSDSIYAEKIIQFKMDRDMWDPEDESLDFVGLGWWKGFKPRNPDLETKKGRKYANNRDSHCTHAAFTKMYNQVENAALKSGNAVKFDEPVCMDREGNIVADPKDAFGLPVPIKFTRPGNCFVLDETGSNTHKKDDGQKGGEKKVVPRGETPKEVVGIKDSHFTVLPVSDLNGKLVFVKVIFAAKKLSSAWTTGVEVFHELVKETESSDPLRNHGPGKRYPGLVLHNDDGKEIPVLFAATPNASITSSILMETFRQMDEKGITQRGVNNDGTPYFPLALLDGHASRMGEEFLRYVNNDDNRWKPILGTPYGTDKWQFHDDKRQNGSFKTYLAEAKSRWIMKKRVHKLPPEVLPQEIVVVLHDAITSSFMVKKFGESAHCDRGWNPFNRAPLDDAEILASAPDAVKKERALVLQSRGIDSDTSANVPVSQRNLLETGSGRLAGGAAAAQEIAKAAQSLNLSGSTASDVMTLMQNAQSKTDGRNKHMAADAATGNQPSTEELQKRYMEAKRFTAGTVFGVGNGELGTNVRPLLERSSCSASSAPT